jgi:hypothetical protein
MRANACKWAASAAILAIGGELAQPFRMSRRSQDSPAIGGHKASGHKAQTRARLSAALRENLKRRKAQARSRATAEGVTGGDKPHDSAGFGGHKPGS